MIEVDLLGIRSSSKVPRNSLLELPIRSQKERTWQFRDLSSAKEATLSFAELIGEREKHQTVTSSRTRGHSRTKIALRILFRTICQLSVEVKQQSMIDSLPTKSLDLLAVLLFQKATQIIKSL